MKFVLFCNLPYAFSILKPLEEEIIKRKFEYIWYVPKDIQVLFPYLKSNYTTDIQDIVAFESDVIFVPGNDVPYYLRGVKTQIFHGLAGEKKGHFRIRDYFDLYLTQGPYFTNKFNKLANKHKNFQVVETGWCKLDTLYLPDKRVLQKRENILKEHNAKYIVLYSPTFSPSLTSAYKLLETINKLGTNKEIVVIIKFHDKMAQDAIENYRALNSKHIKISNEKDITPLLKMSDIMISDTSSVVYEFILLNKPVITLKSTSENINWMNLSTPEKIHDETLRILQGNDTFKEKRQKTIAEYHPYNDALSAQRMIDATLEYIKKYGVPKKRKLNILRKLKILKKYPKK